MLNSLAAQLGLVLVAALSLAGTVYSVAASRNKNEADADKTEAEAEQTSDATWISRLDALGRDFGRLQELSDERFERLVEIEMLITEHVGWDHEVVRLLRKHDMEIDDPPSLQYVRQKLREAKDREMQNNGPDSATVN